MHTVRSTLGVAVGLALAVSTLSTVLATASCSDDLESTYVTEDRFPAAYAQALCTSLQHCCTENSVTFDYESCTSGWRAYVSSTFTATSVNYDPRAATTCVALLNSADSVTCAPAPGSISAARATCQSVFQGTVQVGEACSADSDCAVNDAGPVFCSATVSGSDAGGVLPLDLPLMDGVCAVGALPMAGDPCAAGGTNPCGTDGTLYCDPTAGICDAVGAVGGPCAATVNGSCAAGAYCVSSGPDEDLCAAAQAVGSPCTSTSECDVTGVCDPGSMTCLARKGAGAGCSSGDQCLSGACDAMLKTCLVNSIATSAACIGSGP